MASTDGSGAGGLLAPVRPSVERPADGVVLLRGFAPADAIQPLILAIAAEAPFRRMVTPGGLEMSVAMTNCGAAGWVSDKRGYRYDPTDPMTGQPWPPMPGPLHRLATDAAARAGFSGFDPDMCLINLYEPGTKLGLHQDRDERSFAHPIVSVSLGLSARFQIRADDASGRARMLTLSLEHGDVLVFGGPARLARHGVKPLAEGEHPSFGRRRINLTFRRALTG